MGRSPELLEDFTGFGRIRFLVGPGHAHPLEVPVIEGRWNTAAVTANSDATQVYAVDSLTLDGTTALPLEPWPRPVADLEKVLDVRWAEPFLLEVLDSASGHHLSDIEVRHSPIVSSEAAFGFREVAFRAQFAVGDRLPGRLSLALPVPEVRFQQTRCHPAEPPITSVLLLGGVSPIVVDPIGTSGSYWLTAPGYAWHRWSPSGVTSPATVEATAVHLQPAGELEIVIGAELVSGHSGSTFVRLYHEAIDGDVPIAQCELRGSSSVSFAKLPAGEYRVGLERGSLRARRVLAKAHAVAVPGQTKRVALSARGQPARSAVLYGEFRSPVPGEEAPVRSLRLTPLSVDGAEEPRVIRLQDRASAGIVSWGPITLSVGSYRMDLLPLGLSMTVSVEPGRNDLVVVLPASSSRKVHVVDAGTKENVPITRLEWESFPDVKTRDELVRHLPTPRSRSVAENPVAIDLPSGLLAMRIQADGYGPQERTLFVQPHQDDLLVTLEPRTEIRVFLEHGDELVPYSGEWFSAIAAVGEAGEPVTHTREWRVPYDELPQGRLWVAGEGTCEVRPARHPGLPQLASVQVDLAPREVREVYLRTLETVGR